MKIRIELNWHDKWIGIYDKVKELSYRPGRWTITTYEQHIWICLFPCLPIHIWWKMKGVESRGMLVVRRSLR